MPKPVRPQKATPAPAPAEKKGTLRRLGRMILIVGFLACVGTGFYAACIEPFAVGVTRWTVQTPKWPYTEPLTIALISDPHAIWPWMTPRRLDAIVDMTNALKPDLILLLGDYVATHPFGMQLRPAAGVKPYTNLNAPCGVFAILGNHDVLASTPGWPEALKAAGIDVLENDSRALSCKGRALWVAGLGDLWSDNADLPRAIARISSRAPILLMMHNPDSFPDVPAEVALSVAGHTHGGQIALPGWGPIKAVIPSRYGFRYLYGHVQEDGKDLIVTRGLGTTGLPLRFGTPPEITLVTLEYENKETKDGMAGGRRRNRELHLRYSPPK